MSAHNNEFISIPTAHNPQQQTTIDLVKNYYLAMNKKDMNLFFGIMDQNVIHDVNQGDSVKGIEQFKKFMQDVNTSFDEKLSDIVILVSDDGKYAAGRWTDHGRYFQDFADMDVKATNQKYVLQGGHFFEIKNGKITRVTTFYNLNDFMKQIQ